jgi:hypothetical protein
LAPSHLRYQGLKLIKKNLRNSCRRIRKRSLAKGSREHRQLAILEATLSIETSLLKSTRVVAKHRLKTSSNKRTKLKAEAVELRNRSLNLEVLAVNQTPRATIPH